MKKIFYLLGVAVILFSLLFVNTVKAVPLGLVLNEIYVDGSNEWVEVLNPNTSGDSIDLFGYKIMQGADVRIVSVHRSVPNSGVVVLDDGDFSGGALVFSDTADSITFLDGSDTGLGNISYGGEGQPVASSTGQSLSFINGSWAVQNMTKGWFNDAGQPERAPLLSTIDSTLSASGVETNIGELVNPSATPATESLGALYFEKTGRGKIVFEKLLNLSDGATVAILQNLGTAMEMSANHIKFDSATASAMNATGAKIYFKSLPYETQPDLVIKDDSNNVLNQADVIPGEITYASDPTGACEVGAPVCMMMSFTASHFTQFDLQDRSNVYVDASKTDDSGNGLTIETAKKTIQAGVNLVSAGGVVHVGAGTYTESVTVNKDISIIGEGVTTVVSPATDANGLLINSNGSGATIQNLKINLVTSGVDAQAVRLEGVNNVTISGNTIETTGNKGIGIWVGGKDYANSNNLTIIGNTININGQATGIYAEGGSTAQSGWMIGGSVQNGNTITMATSNALELYDVTNSEVSYNTFTITNAVDASNVMWFSELASLSNLVFSNNTISGSTGSEVAIGTDFKDAPLDPGNAFTGSISTVTISGNTFSNWGSRALRLGKVNGSGTVTGISINANTFQMIEDKEVIGGGATDKTGTENIFNVSGTAKIKKAVDSALGGDTINISAGTYDQGADIIMINKSLTFSGPNATISPNGGSRVFEAVITADVSNGTFNITSSTATVIFKGLKFQTLGAEMREDAPGATITLEKNIFTGSRSDGMYFDDPNLTVNDNLFTSYHTSASETIQMGVPRSSRVGSINITNNTWNDIVGNGALNSGGQSGTISDNTFDGVEYYGILVASDALNTAANLTISNNIFNNITNPTVGPTGNELTWGAGIRFYEASSATVTSVTGNTFSNSYLGVSVRATNSDITNADIDVNRNSFVNNTSNVLNAATGTLNAINNWWNTSILSDISPKISGSVNFLPWYTNEAMTTLVSSAKNISSFSLTTPSATGVITNGETNTVIISVPFGTNVNALTPSVVVSAGATVNPISLNAQNFTNSVVYTVTAEDGSTKVYTVSVNVAKNPAKKITKFEFSSGEGVIDETNHTILVNVPSGTDVTDLSPTITMTGEIVDPESADSQDFTNPITYTVTAEDETTQNYVVTVNVLEEKQVAPETKDDGSAGATLTEEKSEVIITDPEQEVEIEIEKDTVDPKIDISSFKEDDGVETTATVPAITFNSATDLSATSVKVEIPDSTTITAPTGWNGVINAPQVKSNSSVTPIVESGKVSSVSAVIEVGYGDVKLTFNNAVRILVPGQAGKDAGYSRNGVFTQITSVCSADTQVAGNILPAEGDCRIDVGNDLVIWTKHFTSFVAYTQATRVGRTTRVFSSGGGGSSGVVAVVPVVAPVGQVLGATTIVGCGERTSGFSTVTGQSCLSNSLMTNSTTSGQVLGANKFNFTSILRKGSKGNEVMELQKFLTAQGYDLGVADGKFGTKTKNAVIKLQIANKLKSDGVVGPKVRALLNK